MKCITTVTYSVLNNRKQHGHFAPNCGLRQGDPLSPYLFLLCIEGFSSILRKQLTNERLHGIKAATTSSSISHLLFVDDSIIFSKATVEECQVIVDCLNLYEEASSQKVNFHKFGICFSPNTLAEVKIEIQRLLNMDIVIVHDKYLGLPVAIRRSKTLQFQSLKEKLWKKL